MNKPPYILVTSEQAFQSALSHLASSGSLAFDMEMENNYHRYGLHIALIQISEPAGANYIFDPLGGVDMSPLGGILAAPGKGLIVHDAGFDRRAAFHVYKWRFKNVFDTKIAAELCGIRSFGLGSLLESLFGVKTNKRFQKTDWMKRPLRSEALEYAYKDTCHLFAMKRMLEERLEALGRLEWAREEFGACDNRPDPAEAGSGGGRPRIKGASRLSPEQQAVLRAVAEFREKTAQALDLPPHYVIKNETILSLALSPPRDLKSLAATPQMHRALYKPGNLKALFDAIKNGASSPEERIAGEKAGPRGISGEKYKARLAAMQNWRRELGRKLDLEPHLLLANDVLKWRARHERDAFPPQVEAKIRNWQRTLLWEEFEKKFGAR